MFNLKCMKSVPILLLLITMSVSVNLYGADFKWENAATPDLLIDADYVHPQFSPTGELLVQKPQQRGLYLYSMTDGNLKTLVPAGEESIQPCWSADGSQILSRTRNQEVMDAPHQIEIISPMTGERKRLAETYDIRNLPRFAPQGDQVYYPARHGLTYLPLPDKLSKGAASIAPIIEFRNDRLTLTSAVTKSVKTLVPQEGWRVLMAEPSRDGRLLLINTTGGDMYLYDMESGVKTDIGRGDMPVWGYGDNYILFVRTTDDGHDITGSDIYVYDLQEKMLRQVTFTDNVIELEPTWSPDGSTIVYDDYVSHKIFAIDLIR